VQVRFGWIEGIEAEVSPTTNQQQQPLTPTPVIKNYFARSVSAKPSDVVSCSIMPCVRKQGEADRAWFSSAVAAVPSDDACDLARDVDHVVTTAELGKIFAERGIKLQVRVGA